MSFNSSSIVSWASASVRASRAANPVDSRSVGVGLVPLDFAAIRRSRSATGSVRRTGRSLMSSRRVSRKRSSPPQLDDLDLLSDILFGPPEHHPRSQRDHDRALGSLCREAERTISIALAAAADPRLSGLSVVSVIPAPDASRLEIVVAPPHPQASTELAELLACLERIRGALRADLARALQRKRTPDLRFRIGVPEDDPGAVFGTDDGGGE